MSTNPVLEAARPAARAVPVRRAFQLREWLEREAVFSWLMLTPPLLFLLAFLGYPFCYGVYLSFVRRPVAQPATFVGLGNFVNLWSDSIFWQAVWNTFRFTGAATVLKLVGGLGMAPGSNESDEVAIFEATHGTAPKYANQDKVNPGSVILSGEMMFRYMDWTEVADLILKGLSGAIASKRVTYDFARLMEGATEIKCSQFGDNVIEHM